MRTLSSLAALALAAGLAAPASAQEPEAQGAEALRLGVTDVEGLERLQTEWGPFRDALEQATGRAFEFFPVNNRTAAAEALRAERVDLVVTGPAEFVVTQQIAGARALIGLGRPDYFCGIVVMADSPYFRPSDLEGERVALDDIGSTSGHLCPAQVLADYGVDPMEDVEVTHTTRNIAHESLKRGDVAAIGVNYTSWVELARDRDETIPPGAFRVLARSGDLPNDLVMVGDHVDEETANTVRDAIVENKQAVIEGIVSAGGENVKYEGMDIFAVEDEDYDVVRDMYATIDQPRFAEFVGE